MIPSIDPLIRDFQAHNISRGLMLGERGGWKAKAKSVLLSYTFAAEIYIGGKIPEGERATEIQEWLNGQYAWIDALNEKQAGWKIDAQIRLGASLKTFAEYRRRLWDAALRLFHGGSDPSFITTFARSIDVELTKAWNDGAASLNVTPDEMTDRDAEVLSGIIANENEYILNLAADIQAAKEAGMEEDKFQSGFGNRINVWANRYNDTVNQAILYFGAKERLIWKYGSVENHCGTCGQLNGIVAFGDEWSRVGLHPQRPPNTKLECGGWNCGCSLTPTTQRRTRNAIKKLRAIAGRG